MEKQLKTNQTQALTRLLKRINRGADPKLLRKEASKLLPSVGPIEIATAEQNLINDGYSARLVQQLSTAFVLMGILESQGDNLRNRLPGNHVLRRVMAEHDMIRCFLDDLKDIDQVIQNMTELTDVCSEFRKLAHIARHLNVMHEHIAREEDVIFPFLKKHGWASLCRSVCCDHVYIKIALSDMVMLIGTFDKTKAKEFKARLNSITKYLCPTLKEHLFQEENVLYPIALEVINDNKLWEQTKAVCDEIGYCGVHI